MPLPPKGPGAPAAMLASWCCWGTSATPPCTAGTWWSAAVWAVILRMRVCVCERECVHVCACMYVCVCGTNLFARSCTCGALIARHARPCLAPSTQLPVDLQHQRILLCHLRLEGLQTRLPRCQARLPRSQGLLSCPLQEGRRRERGVGAGQGSGAVSSAGAQRERAGGVGVGKGAGVGVGLGLSPLPGHRGRLQGCGCRACLLRRSGKVHK